MRRRCLIAGLLLLAGSRAVGAHTPYGQWVVYRKKHLLIGSHRADPPSYDLAKKLSGVLAAQLPKSKSRVARAPTADRIASLLGTDQLDVAVLNVEDTLAVRDGAGRFAAYGPIAIRQLANLGDHLLVAHERFPARHAWLVAASLHEAAALDEAAQHAEPVIAWHPGAAAFLQGEPQPATD